MRPFRNSKYAAPRAELSAASLGAIVACEEEEEEAEPGAGRVGCCCGTAASALLEPSGRSSRQAASVVVRSIFRFFHRTAGVTSRTYQLRIDVWRSRNGALYETVSPSARSAAAPSVIVTIPVRLSACP